MPRAPISLGQLAPVEKKAALSPAMAQARRMALMDALESGNLTRPLGSGSIVEGLARGAEGFLRTRAARGERETAERKKGEQAQTIAQALAAMQGQEVEGPLRPGEARPMTPGDPRMAASVLAQNPDTAGMGLSLAMAQADRQAQAQAAAQAHQRALAMKAAPGWKAPVPGQDVPLPQGVEAQQQRIADAAAERAASLKAAPGPAVAGRDVPFSPDVQAQWLERKQAEASAKAAAKGEKITEAQKAIDRATGKELAQFVALGGFADAEKGLTQLRGAVEEIRKGGVSGAVVGMTPNFILNAFNPRAVDTQNQIAEVAQRNLRLVLGGQFAMKEGEQLIQRAFNPGLEEPFNEKRVNALISSMEQAMETKKAAWDYLNENGTMRGFKGKQWTMADFEAAVDAAEGKGGGPTDAPPVTPDTRAEDILRKWGVQ